MAVNEGILEMNTVEEIMDELEELIQEIVTRSGSSAMDKLTKRMIFDLEERAEELWDDLHGVKWNCHVRKAALGVDELEEVDSQGERRPGEPGGGMRANCHICSDPLLDGFHPPAPRLVPGLYTGEEKMSDRRFWKDEFWDRYYRMILSQPEENVYKISGIAVFLKQDRHYHSLQVPWDHDSGIVQPYRVDIEQALLATAFVSNLKKNPPKNTLTRYIVHSRCWDVLCHHKIWRISEGDIKVITDAIQRKITRHWKPERFVIVPNYYFASWVMSGKERANRLSSTDVSALQTALGHYLGDSYWRSRINTAHFHEIKAISEEGLDWQYLSSELEQIDSHWDEDTPEDWFPPPEPNDELRSRRWVLGELDEIAALIPQYSST
ncbi:hypothetical protein BDV19DRAFT_388244 [Aspergillus venezuelensis]